MATNLENKIDRIIDDVTDIKVTLARQDVILDKNTESLDHHIRRTDLSEKRIDQVEKYMYRSMGFATAALLAGTLFYALHAMGILAKIV